MPGKLTQIREYRLEKAEALLRNYSGSLPFSRYLSDFFRSHRKFGSTDRKTIAALCYETLRLGASMSDYAVRDWILAGHFLCGNGMDLVDRLGLSSDASAQDMQEAKLKLIAQEFPLFAPEGIFPLSDRLSPSVPVEEFSLAHLHQPDLFLRWRPGKAAPMLRKLGDLEIAFRESGPDGVALPNAMNLDLLGVPDRDFVVQDLSSQKTAFFFPEANKLPSRPGVWDCCAGSGGKSILATDLLPNPRIVVTDNRQKILEQLRERFRQAGISKYKSCCIDLADPALNLAAIQSATGQEAFDLVIADIPCSGSGTWGRTPEWLSFFKADRLSDFVNLQRAILKKIVPMIKPGGWLVYITCSVYREENEDQVGWLQSEYALKLQKGAVLEGWKERADTMFAACFISES